MDLSRTINLIGKENLEILTDLKIIIIGLGGVGGYALESLVRIGIKNITIVDGDKIDKTNLNRQLVTNRTNIGEFKTEAWAKRINLINDKTNVKIVTKMLNPEDINALIKDHYFIIDACDDTKVKIAIIKEAMKKKIDFISCMGTANKIDATKLEITKLSKTKNCPLARKLRNELKKSNIDINKINVVTSNEVPINNGNLKATISYVPAVAVLYITNYIVNKYLKESNYGRNS